MTLKHFLKKRKDCYNLMHVVFFSTEAKCELVKQYMRRKMRKRAKTTLALLLALSCSFSTYVSAATIANETVLSEGIKQSFPEEKSVTSSENLMEENALEEDALEENVMGKNVVEEKNEIEKEISAIESEATEENAFYAEKELSGVLVTVQADSGVFPKGATLRVRKLSSAEYQKFLAIQSRC